MLGLLSAIVLTAPSVQAVPPPTVVPSTQDGQAVQSRPAVVDPAIENAEPQSQRDAPSPVSGRNPPTASQRSAKTAPQADIVVLGRNRESAGDPLRSVNAEAFGATQAVDKAVIGPVARAYKKTVPSPFRRGIHNFLYNLREPIVFVNFLLQFKPGKAAETVGRFAINSTIGAVGVLDIAKRKPFRLPRRSNGFANTLGYHGVKNGPFLFLPLVGPTTVRDLIGGALDRLLLPVAVGQPFTSPTYTAPAGILGALDHRSEFDDTLKDLHDNSPDPYAATRAFYLRRRQAEIDHLHGRNDGDPSGMSGPPPSVVPFVPKSLAPNATPPETDGAIAPEKTAPQSPETSMSETPDLVAPVSETPVEKTIPNP